MDVSWEVFGWIKERSLDAVVTADMFERHDSDGVIEQFFVASLHRPGYKIRE